MGLGCTTVKTPDIRKMHEHALSILPSSCEKELSLDPLGRLTFYLRDYDNNLFQILESDKWFTNHGHPSGGIMGCTIGVSSIEKALELYSDILGYDEVLYDSEGVFDDWNGLPGGEEKYRRVILKQSKPGTGGFAAVMGETQLNSFKLLIEKVASFSKIESGRIQELLT